MKRFNVLLLCTAGARTSFSTFAAFLQPGKITAGSDRHGAVPEKRRIDPGA